MRELKVIEKPNGRGIGRIIKASNCSIKGLKAAYVNEAAFRQELWFCIALFPISFVISSTLTTWLMLISSLFLVLIAEILNSAVEALADRISLEHHELIGRAKDLGSAAVSISIVLTVIIWSSVIYSHFKS